MVTAVTVTVFDGSVRKPGWIPLYDGAAFPLLCTTLYTHLGNWKPRNLKFARTQEKLQGNREKGGTFSSLAYTQMIVCLYPNNYATVRKLNRISFDLIATLGGVAHYSVPVSLRT